MSNPIKPMPRKPPVEFTHERKEAFIEAYRRTGLVYLSAEAAGVSDWTVQDHRKKDPEFNQLCEQAKQRWVDEVLVREALRRAVTGIEEPIIGGKFRDEIVTHVRRYSDGLLSSMLRANRQEFRDGQSEASQAAGSQPVMFIPQAAPATLDDWEARYGEDAKGQRGKPE